MEEVDEDEDENKDRLGVGHQHELLLGVFQLGLSKPNEKKFKDETLNLRTRSNQHTLRGWSSGVAVACS